MKKYVLLLTALVLLTWLSGIAQEKIIGFNSSGGKDNTGTTYRINTDGTGFEINAKFTYTLGGAPVDMIDGNDGYIYGTCYGNSFAGDGTIFRLNYDGTNYTILKKFIKATQGSGTRYRPVLGNDGYLYGINELGGTNNTGTIWKLNLIDTSLTVLYNFPVGGDPNSYSGYFGSLTFGFDGKLYGYCGGGSYNGHLFKLNTNGTGFTILKHMTGNSNSTVPGGGVTGTLTLASDGSFYGVSSGGGLFNGGINNKGLVFKYNPVSDAYTVVHYFALDESEGYNPACITEGPGGNLYGGCNHGGLPSSSAFGTFWKVAKNGTGFSVIKNFTVETTGTNLVHRVYTGNGFLYFATQSYATTTGSGGGAFMKIGADGSNFSVLRTDFNGFPAPNNFFFRQDVSDAKFYCVSNTSGSNIALFKMDTTGANVQKIHQFAWASYGQVPAGRPQYVSNASSPQNGRVFGFASQQGLQNNGVLFKYYPGTANVPDRVSSLQPAVGFLGDNAYGVTSPLLASDGKIYGTFSNTGASGTGINYTGTMYSLDPNDTSTLTLIKGFNNLPGGTGATSPISQLLEGVDGYLYGTTYGSGANNRGTIYKVQKDGSNYSNIYNFATGESCGSLLQDATTQIIYYSTGSSIFQINPNGTGRLLLKNFTDGSGLNSALILSNDSLYGVATTGFQYDWYIYKMHKNGSGFAILRTSTGTANGYSPNGYLAPSSDGYLYGTCLYGGSNNYGVVYKIKRDGTGFTVLKHFDNTNDGGYPTAVTLQPCTAPNNATNITFANSSTNTITISGFTAPAGGATGYVIKMNIADMGGDIPAGTNPTANTVYNGTGEQVIYNGTTIPTALRITGLLPNTVYYFKVSAYGCGRNYSNANTTGNPTSMRTQPPSIFRVSDRMSHYNGTNQYADAGDVNQLENIGAISFGGWVKPLAFPSATLSQKSIVSKGDGVTVASTAFFIKMYKDESDFTVKISAGINVGGTLTPINLTVDSSLFRYNQWSHVMVIWQSGGKIKLYINGRKAAESFGNVTGTINNVTSPLRLGSSTATSENTWNGDLEEFQFYNVALAECELRQRMHITLTGTEPGLVSYYQFNDDPSSTAFNDNVGLHHANRVNGVTNPVSNLAVAGGASACNTITNTDLMYRYNASDLSNRIMLQFPTLSPDGVLNGSYLEGVPVGGNPLPGSYMLPGYWIVNNFGNNTSNLNATVVFSFPDGTLTDIDPTHYTLYKRPSYSFGTWTAFPITAVSIATGNNTITINGIPDFSQLVITSTNTSLPLQLLDFTGNMAGNNAQLQWQTANEINVKHFELERHLPNDNGFTSIVTITAQNGVANNYQYTDNNLPTGTTWYRLKMVDNDGKTTYSQIVMVKNMRSENTLVYPNPAKNILNIVLPSTASNVVAQIVSIDGRLIKSDIKLQANLNTIQIADLKSGLYILKTTYNNNTQQTKFIKE